MIVCCFCYVRFLFVVVFFSPQTRQDVIYNYNRVIRDVISVIWISIPVIPVITLSVIVISKHRVLSQVSMLSRGCTDTGSVLNRCL